MKSKKILITGGAGYIGSHMVGVLLDNGYEPIVFDNLSTGHRSFVPRGVSFFKGDLRKSSDVEKVFKKFSIDAVIHFAASIIVPESVEQPIKYYENNTVASLNLAREMTCAGVNKLIVSSTAAVFGEPEKIPVTEDSPTEPTNPYGRSKLIEEQILRDISAASKLRFISLRYFNVAGSSMDARTGIRYKKITHLIPCLMMAASGRAKDFTICGTDYDTKDGTCLRDFIYVVDLCYAHLKALEALDKGHKSDVFNLGSGDGFSVGEMVEVAKKVCGKTFIVKKGKRRPGDPSKIVASYAKAKKILGWEPKATLNDIVLSSWIWEQKEVKRIAKS